MSEAQTEVGRASCPSCGKWFPLRRIRVGNARGDGMDVDLLSFPEALTCPFCAHPFSRQEYTEAIGSHAARVVKVVIPSKGARRPWWKLWA